MQLVPALAWLPPQFIFRPRCLSGSRIPGLTPTNVSPWERLATTSPCRKLLGFAHKVLQEWASLPFPSEWSTRQRQTVATKKWHKQNRKIIIPVLQSTCQCVTLYQGNNPIKQKQHECIQQHPADGHPVDGTDPNWTSVWKFRWFTSHLGWQFKRMVCSYFFNPWYMIKTEFSLIFLCGKWTVEISHMFLQYFLIF